MNYPRRYVMNIKTTAFFPGNALKEVFPSVLLGGTELLKNSKKIKRYRVSLREVFGLCILTHFRKFLYPDENWVFSTESQLSDDGVVARFNDRNNKFNYYEKVEQIYLPGNFLKKRDAKQNINDYILSYIFKTKIDKKGFSYQKDTALFVLCDINSKNLHDYFEWQDFTKKFFCKRTFLHLYFLSLIRHTLEYNKYYLLSFTNQKHRQELNGEFELKIYNNGVIKFKCLQRLSLI